MVLEVRGVLVAWEWEHEQKAPPRAVPLPLVVLHLLQWRQSPQKYEHPLVPLLQGSGRGPHQFGTAVQHGATPLHILQPPTPFPPPPCCCCGYLGESVDSPFAYDATAASCTNCNGMCVLESWVHNVSGVLYQAVLGQGAQSWWQQLQAVEPWVPAHAWTGKAIGKQLQAYRASFFFQI